MAMLTCTPSRYAYLHPMYNIGGCSWKWAPRRLVVPLGPIEDFIIMGELPHFSRNFDLAIWVKP